MCHVREFGGAAKRYKKANAYLCAMFLPIYILREMDGRSTEVRHSGELEPLGNEDVIQQEELPSQGTIKDIQGASRVASKKAVVASSCGLGIRKDWKLRLFVRILDLDEILSQKSHDNYGGSSPFAVR